MATREEIAGAIQQGMAAVDETFGGLTDEQLASEIYDGGWTAKQVLAHLAGRKAGYDLLFAMASGEQAASFGEDFDFAGWNQRFVDERAGRSRDELIAECRDVHEGLLERVASLDDAALEIMVDLPNGAVSVGDMLAGSGGMHSVNHSADVAKALGLD